MEVSPWISPRALNYSIGRGIIQPPHPIHAFPPTFADNTAKPGPFGLGITYSPPVLSKMKPQDVKRSFYQPKPLF